MHASGLTILIVETTMLWFVKAGLYKRIGSYVEKFYKARVVLLLNQQNI